MTEEQAKTIYELAELGRRVVDAAMKLPPNDPEMQEEQFEVDQEERTKDVRAINAFAEEHGLPGRMQGAARPPRIRGRNIPEGAY